MKKFLKLKNVVIFMASLLSLGSMVACGQTNSAVPYAPIVTGPAVSCLPGEVGCLTTTGSSAYEACIASGGNPNTVSSDGTPVCAQVIQQTWEFEGTQDYLGPNGGPGFGVGVLYFGDAVTLTAAGSWGTNTCNWNFCTSWSGCSCSCSGGSSVADANSGFYGELAGTMIQIGSGTSFEALEASVTGSELYVGFNAFGSGNMTCWGFTINAQVTRCYDINGLTHPCLQGQ